MRATGTAAIGLSIFPRRAFAQLALTTVRVGGSPNDDMTAIVYAQRTGLYQKAGLDVVIEKTTSGAAAAAAVAAGAYDIGKSSTASIFDAHIKGIPFTLLGPTAIYDSSTPYGGFLLSNSTPFASGKDAEGQTVACASLGSIGRVAFAAWVAQHGGDPRTVKFVELPIPAVPPALDTKRIVAGETSEPTQTLARTNGYRYLPAYSAIASRFVAAVYYTTKDFSAKHPEAVRAFMAATYESARIANAKPASTVKIMAEYIGVPTDVITNTPRIQLGTELILDQLQPAIDAAAKYGTISHAFAARELVDANVSFR
jgi:NitT/TauT family transport system substrate-binding protein